MLPAYDRDADDVLERLRAAAPAALGGEQVILAYLFDSHARGTASPGSDVDVALLLLPEVPSTWTSSSVWHGGWPMPPAWPTWTSSCSTTPRCPCAAG